ncbi:MAG: hypothetical protein AB1586_10835 [Pseudomonadota bacterium]|jgi:hypothetical protein
MMRKSSLQSIAAITALCVVATCLSPGRALSRDDEDGDGEKPKAKPQFPTTYLDMRTTLTALPPDTLSVGFGGTFPSLSSLPALSGVHSQHLTLDLPLTIDLSDRLSIYGGVTALTTHTDITPWSPLTLDTWNIGFQAEVIQQKGGSIPTVTVQSTLTRSIAQTLLATTSSTTIAEASYAFDKDETRGVLAGVRFIGVAVDSDVAKVNPSVTGYVGGYYQWDNNWKLTGRAGVQSFGGATIAGRTPLQPFTQPVLRIDLDRMDDNDNRLFGVTAEIDWTPKPAFQFVLRTPLYLVRN